MLKYTPLTPLWKGNIMQMNYTSSDYFYGPLQPASITMSRLVMWPVVLTWRWAPHLMTSTNTPSGQRLTMCSIISSSYFRLWASLTLLGLMLDGRVVGQITNSHNCWWGLWLLVCCYGKPGNMCASVFDSFSVKMYQTGTGAAFSSQAFSPSYVSCVRTNAVKALQERLLENVLCSPWSEVIITSLPSHCRQPFHLRLSPFVIVINTFTFRCGCFEHTSTFTLSEHLLAHSCWQFY